MKSRQERIAAEKKEKEGRETSEPLQKPKRVEMQISIGKIKKKSGTRQRGPPGQNRTKKLSRGTGGEGKTVNSSCK